MDRLIRGDIMADDEKTAKKAKSDYFDAIATAMRDAGITNPRELEDVTVDAIQKAHGL